MKKFLFVLHYACSWCSIINAQFRNLKLSWPISWHVPIKRYYNCQSLIIALIRVLAGKSMTLSQGVTKKSYAGMVKRSQEGIKNKAPGSWQQEGILHPCMPQRARTWEDLWVWKAPGDEHTYYQISLQPGGREAEAREVNIPNPVLIVCYLLSDSFMQPQLEAGGQGSQLMESIEVHCLDTWGGEWRIYWRSKQKIPTAVVHWEKCYPRLLYLSLQNLVVQKHVCRPRLRPWLFWFQTPFFSALLLVILSLLVMPLVVTMADAQISSFFCE